MQAFVNIVETFGETALCGYFPVASGGSNEDMSPFTRRDVLRAAGTFALAGAAAGPQAIPAAGSVPAADSTFRHGVASGDPFPDGVLLWTRVTPTPESTPGSGIGPEVKVT